MHRERALHILNLVACFDNVLWSYVNRRGNKVAHELAHKASLEVGETIWDDDFPSFVVVGSHSDLMK